MHVDDVEKAAGPLYHRALQLRDFLIVWTVVFRPGKIKYPPCSGAKEFRIFGKARIIRQSWSQICDG